MNGQPSNGMQWTRYALASCAADAERWAALRSIHRVIHIGDYP